MSVYLQLSSLKPKIIYGDALSWLPNFLVSVVLSSILFEDLFTKADLYK